MNIITRWLTGRQLYINYSMDEKAQIARVYVNKKERHWTESDKIQIQNVVNHFANELKYLVMVED